MLKGLVTRDIDHSACHFFASVDIAVAANKGLRLVSGEWIACLDDDEFSGGSFGSIDKPCSKHFLTPTRSQYQLSKYHNCATSRIRGRPYAMDLNFFQTTP